MAKEVPDLLRPLIGIASDTTAKRKDDATSYVSAGYANAVLDAGGLPVIIPPCAKESTLADYLNRLDGVLMTDGKDLAPLPLRLRPNPVVKIMDPAREKSDRWLIRFLMERKMPALFVGTSMQLLNVMLGGELYSYLPEDMPRGMQHRNDSDPVPQRHRVFITPGTVLEDIYGIGEIVVGSQHFRGISKVAPSLRSSAIAGDGLVEAVESRDKDWFGVGVQWVPVGVSALALDMQLLESFVGVSSATAPARQARIAKGEDEMEKRVADDLTRRIKELERRDRVVASVDHVVGQIADLKSGLEDVVGVVQRLESMQPDPIAIQIEQITTETKHQAADGELLRQVAEVATVAANLALSVAYQLGDKDLEPVSEELLKLTNELEDSMPSGPTIYQDKPKRRQQLDTDIENESIDPEADDYDDKQIPMDTATVCA